MQQKKKNHCYLKKHEIRSCYIFTAFALVLTLGCWNETNATFISEVQSSEKQPEREARRCKFAMFMTRVSQVQEAGGQFIQNSSREGLGEEVFGKEVWREEFGEEVDGGPGKSDPKFR